MDCSWGVLEHYKELSPEYLRKTAALKALYHPIELDHRLTNEEKIPHMVEWYTQVTERSSGADSDQMLRAAKSYWI